MTDTNKASANKLIMDFFGRKEGQTTGEFLQELRSVPEAARIQLASAIARQRGMSQDVLGFELVAY